MSEAEQTSAEGTDLPDRTFEGMDRPRIRHITGLRIHHLTLPDVPTPSNRTSPPTTPSASVFADATSLPALPRRPSHRRERSASSSTISPVAYRSRTGTIVGRARAPTLAGEALEHAKVVAEEIQEDDATFKPKRLARTFMVLRLPDSGPSTRLSTDGEVHTRTSRKGKEKAVDGYSLKAERPSLSTASSRSSFRSPPSSGGSTPVRTPSKSNNRLDVKQVNTELTKRTFGSRPGVHRSSSSSIRVKTNGHTGVNGRNLDPIADVPKTDDLVVPFYISPIHQPSTNPRFLHFEEGEFAPWLTVEEGASDQAVLEVWYETESGWSKAEDVGGRFVLGHLRRLDKDVQLPDNAVLVNLSTDPRSTFYIPLGNAAQEAGRGTVASGVMERSRRETRMKKGVGLGGLHQLVNMQTVIADTRRSIAEVQRKIDALLRNDVDGRALKRSVSETRSRVRWLQVKVGEVEKRTEEVQAHITLHRQSLDERRARLKEAEIADHLVHSRLSDLSTDIHTVETDRSSLLPAIHHTRSQHVQALDALFPISPLHPPSLLYSILDIPLPIPIGAKDPAPPLMMNLPESRGKVDERTTAAALGYVAMVVQILGNLSTTRKEGGLSYPITCAGSRSLVKDTVSVMQGPRSFPLYAKGVERYRYEYAVFLLNKNVEMLMQEASIRLLDLRHTLPNLKALLLTLSSPVPPPSRRPPPSSRQTSAAYSLPNFSPGRDGSPGSSTRVGSVTPGSPIALGRRSRLNRGVTVDTDEKGDSESEDDTELDSVARSVIASP